MNNLATGIDIVEITRLASAIEDHGENFLNRIFTPGELLEVGDKTASLAARFAAKEAVAKALGTGIGPINWKEIEILRGTAGKPELFLNGQAAVIADKLRLDKWSISLSHSHTYAIAVAVAISLG
jgi:holo-[acyl-carrier protein] synthase